MPSNIQNSLERLFEKKRIVFWYDSEKEFREEFDAVNISNAEKIEILDNEFSIKYKVLVEGPDKKYLIYKEGPEPERPTDNWLLDVQLSNTVFKTNQTSVWLAELGLDVNFASAVEEHARFFKSVGRLNALKDIEGFSENHNKFRLGMMSVCASTDCNIDSILESLLSDLAKEKSDKMNQISKYNLSEFLWSEVEKRFSYSSDEKSINDLAIEVLNSCFNRGIDEHSTLNIESIIFLRRWRDSSQHKQFFNILSKKISSQLNIHSKLLEIDFRKLLKIDYFREIDEKIITSLIHELTEQTSTNTNVIKWASERRVTHWYLEFESCYEAIYEAANFFEALKSIDLNMQSIDDGIKKYTSIWYKVDLHYRKYNYFLSASSQHSLFKSVTTKIENLYSNNFLLPVNDNWQSHVQKVNEWGQWSTKIQKNFYSDWVKPFSKQDKKICVIISDALRYEVASELLKKLLNEDKFQAEINPIVAMLPSYTQLGMASLLPNSELEISLDEGVPVIVDGQTSKGNANRGKILENATSEKSTTLKSSDFVQLKIEDARVITRENSTVFIYHNRIDAAGDQSASEGIVFEAVEDTISELIKLIKKLTNSNVNNILLTSDHGFLFQNKELQESDFSSSKIEGDIIHKSRRFVIGKNLKFDQGMKKFTASQLHLKGDFEVLIPNSINRLRVKGSGSRYVHGGASLQEIIIPVISINKKRESDTTQVDVRLIPSTSNLITTSQLPVLLYQGQPVEDKTLPRKIRVGVYASNGKLISDTKEILFDSQSSNAKERETSFTLILSRDADAENNKEVQLKLEERIQNTSHYEEYAVIKYTIRRSFGNDFDI